MTTATLDRPGILSVRQRDRFFFGAMALAIAAAVFVGFAPTFYLRPDTLSPLPPYLRVHGLAFTAWIALFITQTALIAAGRTPLHRRLGWAGAALAAFMVVAGTAAGVWSMQREVANGNADAAMTFLTTPISAMLVFALLVGAAVIWRHRPDTHKRLMLLATLSLLDAAVARWPFAFSADWMFYAITDLFIVAAIAYDLLSRRRVAMAYVWGAGLIVLCQGLRPIVGETGTWHAIARAILQ